MGRLKNGLLGVTILVIAVLFEQSQRRRTMDSTTKRDMRATFRLFLIAVLCIGVIRLMCGCAGQKITPMAPKDTLSLTPLRVQITDTLPTQGQAMTDCDSTGRVTIYVLKSMVHSPGYAELLIHEVTHLRQMDASHMSCREYLRYFRAHRSFRLHVEAEAYCSALTIPVAESQRPWIEYTEGITQFLYDNYQLNMTWKEVEDEVNKTCARLFKESG